MEKQHLEDEIEIDLKELLLVVLHNWKKIFISGFLLGVIVLAYCMLIVTPMYESTSKLYVLTKSTSVTSLADIQSGTNLTQDYQLVVGGRPVVDSVIANLELDEDYESFSANLTVQNPNDTRIINITYKNADPEVAKEIVDELAQVAAVYISEKMDQDPPTVIERGYSDGNKVSPNTKQNAVLGFILGVLIASGIVIVTHIFNDTIMTTNDIEKHLGLSTLAVVPLEDEEGKVVVKKKGKKAKRVDKWKK